MRETGERHDGRGNNPPRQELESQPASPTLDDLGVTKDESSRWQAVAAVPAPKQRQAVVVALREAGHSNRAIAGALGVSHQTVGRDIEAAEIGPRGPIKPERVTRQGGGTYPSRRAPTVLARSDREQERAQTALAVSDETPPDHDEPEPPRAPEPPATLADLGVKSATGACTGRRTGPSMPTSPSDGTSVGTTPTRPSRPPRWRVSWVQLYPPAPRPWPAGATSWLRQLVQTHQFDPSAPWASMVSRDSGISW